MIGRWVGASVSKWSVVGWSVVGGFNKTLQNMYKLKIWKQLGSEIEHGSTVQY